MENDGMGNEEKKQRKHIYEIRLSLTCHFFSLLFPPKPKKRTNFSPATLLKRNSFTGFF